MNLHTQAQYLKGVGEKRAAALRKLGIVTLGDLIAHTPRAYEDWQSIHAIARAPVGEHCCIRAAVDHPPTEQLTRSGKILYKTSVTDASGSLGITIFNSGYQAKKLKAGEEYLFYGRINESFFSREMTSPQLAAVDEARLRPVYPLTEGLSSRQVETLIARALDQVGPQVKEFLPEALLEQYELMPRLEALRAIHRPADMEDALRARRRLAFNELFTLQLSLGMLKQGRSRQQAYALDPAPALDFLGTLPFAPTEAQRRAVTEAAEGMAQPRPMYRLLQGDVGSGKTAAAAALLYQAEQNGCQAAMLAPTELLARQHFETLQDLGLSPALLIGSTPAGQKKQLKAALAEGSQGLIVGTHALLQGDVQFRRLALLIVDEQHRFGVEQRNRLGEGEGVQPHVYVMSATPIPRSLAMILYGDLDISILDELPPGRKPIETYCVSSQLRARAYQYVKKHLDAGQQGYIICPRVEEEGESELAAAKQFYESLSQGEFADYRLGLLHGKLKPKPKEEIMRSFAAGETQLLVATTVVEVGVDVPNAVIMVIENAERYGLSQLHQLRGRVGRGAGKSTCILISDAENPEAQSRFTVMKDSSDGFEIARRDLELRGPGNFFGARQHGLPPFKLADLAADSELLAQTRAAAGEILAQDPDLALPEHEILKKISKTLISS